MKKLLRLLVGGKQAAPVPERPAAPVHELALKAVARRLAKRARGETVSDQSVAAEDPVMADQSGSTTAGAVERRSEESPSGPPGKAMEKEGRRRRRTRRASTAGVAGAAADEVGAGEGVGRAGEKASPLLGRGKRRQRRLDRRKSKQVEPL